MESEVWEKVFSNKVIVTLGKKIKICRIRSPPVLAPVVQKLDSAIHRINHYPADKYYGNQLRYSVDRDLSGG